MQAFSNNQEPSDYYNQKDKSGDTTNREQNSYGFLMQSPSFNSRAAASNIMSRGAFEGQSSSKNGGSHSRKHSSKKMKNYLVIS